MIVTALLTGRGNNTLKDKNVLDVLGHPVLYYPAHAARQCECFHSFYCSSDDEKILQAAQDEGYQRIVRPAVLAAPDAQHVDAILHALLVIDRQSGLPDILVVLLANNISVKSEWIEQCVQLMQEDMTISAVVPVYRDNDHHPLRSKRLDDDGFLHMYEKNAPAGVSTNRQDLPACYYLSHNFWVLNVKQMFDARCKGQAPWCFMGNRIRSYEVSESIDIHNHTDLIVAREWIKDNYTD